MNIIKRISKNGEKEYYSFELGRCAGSRIATGIFTHTEPKNQIEKNHNKEALRLLDTRKSELSLEHQAIGSGFIPEHKFKGNFLESDGLLLFVLQDSGESLFPMGSHQSSCHRRNWYHDPHHNGMSAR